MVSNISLCFDGGNARVVVRVERLEGRLVRLSVVFSFLLQRNSVDDVCGIGEFNLNKKVCCEE